MLASTLARRSIRGQRLFQQLQNAANRRTRLLIHTQALLFSDRVAPAEDHISWDTKTPHKIRIGEEAPANYAPMCIQSMMRNTVKEFPDNKAMAVKRDGEWASWNWVEYQRDARNTAKGFLACGLERQCGVGIMAHNCPEFALSSIGSIFAGGLSVGIYMTYSPEMIYYQGKHAPLNIIVIQDEALLDQVLDGKELKSVLPTVKRVVLIEGENRRGRPEVMTWAQLQEMGRATPDSELDRIEEEQFVNEACVLVYTSGTTGKPKGVMVSQENITYLVRCGELNNEFKKGAYSTVSFLPLAHMAALLIDVFGPLYFAPAVYYADKDALKGTLINTLREVRPNKFFAVPRVWEKMQERMQETSKEASSLRKMVANWAKRQGTEYHVNKRKYGDAYKPKLGYRIARKVIFQRVYEALGLENAVDTPGGGFYVSAAPLSMQTFEYFESLGIELQEVFGCTETTGPQATNQPGFGKFKPGSVGREHVGVQNKILDPDEEGYGEICTRGRNIFMGYHRDEAATRAAKPDGEWYRSGDIGRIDEDGFLWLKGRIKEMIVTAGGLNVAPVPIENRIKKDLSSIISNVMIVGDEKNYLTCLMTLRVEVDAETMQPTDKLDKSALFWIKKQIGDNSATPKTVADFCDGPNKDKLMAAIQEGLDRANKQAYAHYQIVQKFTVLPEELSVKGEELGPTLKLKRHFMVKKYADLIDEMYKN